MKKSKTRCGVAALAVVALLLAASLSFAQVVDFSAITPTGPIASIYTDPGTGLIASGYYRSGSSWIQTDLNLWVRNDPPDNVGLGVCNPNEVANCTSGEFNELSNNVSPELIVLKLPPGYTWVRVWISSLDTGNGAIERGQLWASNAIPNNQSPGALGGTRLIQYAGNGSFQSSLTSLVQVTDPGGTATANYSIAIPSAFATTPFLIFEPFDWSVGPNTNNDHLVWKVELAKGCPEFCVNANPLLGDARGCTVLELNGGKVSLSYGGPTGVTGNVCIASGGSLSMSGGQVITGAAIFEDTTPKLSQSGSTQIQGGVVSRSLSVEKTAATTLAAHAAGLPCDRTLTDLSGQSVITPVNNGGQNVICVGNFQVNSNQLITLTGGPDTSYIFNVTGTFKINGSDQGGKVQVGGAVAPSDVLYNVIGSGADVAFSGGGGGSLSTIKAIVDGTILAPNRKIALSPGLVNGQIISGNDISIVSGSFVRCPSGCP